MKVLSITFEDSVDLSQFPDGEEVTVTKDTSSETGNVLIHATMQDPEAIPHTHSVGPPEPEP